MKKPPLIGFFAAAIAITALAAAIWIFQNTFSDFDSQSEREAAFQAEAHYGVEIMGAPTTPTVLTDALDYHGRPAEIACATCHTTRTPAATRQSEDLDAFHQGLIMQHGDLSCLSCHNSENYDTLKLADGTPVGFEDTMLLCAQCHGPQSRDYRNGSHGGMVGYWDLSRGPRQRNACTVCHDVHAPAYPQLMPVFPPRDIIPPKDTVHSEH